MFPLEPIGIFVDGQKMMSKTGSQIRFWAHHQLAQEFYQDQKILSHLQFDALVNWLSVHRTLHNLSWLFQIWAAKHVLGIAGTMKFLAHQMAEAQCVQAAIAVKNRAHMLKGARRQGGCSRLSNPHR
jgi:hypothetical protein